MAEPHEGSGRASRGILGEPARAACRPTILNTNAALRDGSITSSELVDRTLRLARTHDAEVGSFVTVFEDAARARAAEADRELAAGRDRGALHGVPIAIKDLISTAEGPTTGQSVLLPDGWGNRLDAPVVRRLRDAGAVIVGKTTTMELGIGLPQPGDRVPRNPWDTTRWAGGSSSGTANGLSAGFFLGGLGTDTGGSIRLPAAFCGVTGLLPSYGLVPRAGTVPFASTMDHVGPMAISAWDCAALMDLIAGGDGADSASRAGRGPDFLKAIDRGVAGLQIGVVRELLDPGTPDEIVHVFDAAVSVLCDGGAEVVEVELPLQQAVSAAAIVTMACEGAARYHDELCSRWADFGAGTRSTLAWGALVSGADYAQAQRVRRAGQAALAELFDRVDVVVTPTAAVTAVPVTALDAIMELFARVFTVYWNVLENPVLTVPIGFVGGLPLGMQIAAPPFADDRVLRVGHAFQRVTDWHLRTPFLTGPSTGAAAL